MVGSTVGDIPGVRIYLDAGELRLTGDAAVAFARRLAARTTPFRAQDVLDWCTSALSFEVMRDTLAKLVEIGALRYADWEHARAGESHESG